MYFSVFVSVLFISSSGDLCKITNFPLHSVSSVSDCVVKEGKVQTQKKRGRKWWSKAWNLCEGARSLLLKPIFNWLHFSFQEDFQGCSCTYLQVMLSSDEWPKKNPASGSIYFCCLCEDFWTHSWMWCSLILYSPAYFITGTAWENVDTIQCPN